MLCPFVKRLAKVPDQGGRRAHGRGRAGRPSGSAHQQIQVSRLHESGQPSTPENWDTTCQKAGQPRTLFTHLHRTA